MKKSRNHINNNNFVPSLQISNVLPNIKNIKLNPYKFINKKASINNNAHVNNIINKEMSVLLFQNNEVNVVRNLNIDDEKNFCDNLLYKGVLENNMINEEEIYGNSDKSSGVNLPKIKSLTINGILESEKKLNENKKISLRNLANNQLEKELYDNLKDLRRKIKDYKNNKNELYKNYEKITKQIKEINIEIEALKSDVGDTFFFFFFDLNSPSFDSDQQYDENLNNILLETPSKLLKSPKKEKKDSSSKKLIKNLWGKSKYEEKIKRIKMLYVAKKEKDEKKIYKHRVVNQLKEELKKIDIELSDINTKLDEFKIQESDIIQKLMRHYEGLLYRGKDTRSDGLIWIIKAIWKLGKNVPMQFIPTFLDFNAIEFLFKLANKSIELENKKKQLNESKKNLIVKVHKLYFFNNNKIDTDINNFSKKLAEGKNRRSSLLFKTNLIKKNKILRRSISQTNIVKTYIHSAVDDEQREEEKNTFKEISKIIEKRENVEIEKMAGMGDIEELQKKIRNIENEIIELKNKEIIRIFKEFIENDYQNKYHVNIDIVLAALLGEHTKNIEVNRFAKFKKEYIENLKNIRFYEYRKKNNDK